MHSYSSTLTVQSAVFPGVEFDVRKPSYGQKVEFDKLNADYRDEVRQISKQHRELKAEYNATVEEFRFAIDREVADARKELAAAETDEAKAAAEARIAELEASVCEVDPQIVEQITELGERAQRLTNTVYNPRRIRWGLKAVRGLEIDGNQNPDADTIISAGLSEFAVEILEAIDTVAGMTAEQLKNSPSPITFSALVEPTKTDTTASAVNNPPSTETETAAK